MNDDLSSLFVPPPRTPALAASFRQGVLAAFDTGTGDSTVVLGTSVLTNLPMLATGAEIGLTVGDNVLLAQMGNTYLIMGKIASAGGANFGSSRLGNNSGLTSASGFSVTGGFVDNFVCTNSDDIAPNWARSMMIQVGASASLHNNSGGLDNIQSSVQMSNPSGGFANGIPVSTAVANTQIGSTTSFINGLFACTPGQPVTFRYSIRTGNNWPADAGAIAQMWHSIWFYREAIS